MRRIVFIFTLLICFANEIVAQQYVSTEPSLKNVVIEEFTGKSCSACPHSHKTINELMRSYPGRVFAIYIHPDGIASYPNFETDDGQTIYNAMSGSGLPNGHINRCTCNGYSTLLTAEHVYQHTNEEALCNIGGIVVVDEASRTATINVEVYYTGDTDVDANYLTVTMLQDSIWGAQINGETNMEQYLDGLYCHMQILRDVITPTWGDEISPTTKGTLITKTYKYTIPEIIGDPNGVEVNINHLEFIAFVTNQKNEYKSYPILNVCRLPLLIKSQETVFPHFEMVTEKHPDLCSNYRTFIINMMNRGIDELTSIKMLMEIDNGDTFEYEWKGKMASYDIERIEFDMEVPIGTHEINFKIIEANGIAFNYSKTLSITRDEWHTIFVEHENDEIVFELMQDKFGSETTWQIVDDNDFVVASGGPYDYFFGQPEATELHEIPLKLPLNQCLRFTISDSAENGICCDFGEGYYKIIDGHGNVVIDGDGEFGSKASYIFTLEVGNDVNEIEEETFRVYPNPARNIVKLSTANYHLSAVRIYNCLGMMVEEISLGTQHASSASTDVIDIDVSDYKSGIYFINIFDNNGNVATKKISVINN